MKKILCFCCALCLLFILFGCQNNNSPASDTAPTAPEKIAVSLPAFEEAEFESVAKEWQARAEAFINADEIESVTFGVYIIGEPDLYTSDDPKIIERWQALIAHMRLTVVPFEMYYGGAEGITYRCGGEEVVLFGTFSSDLGIPINLGNSSEGELPTAALQVDNREEVETEYLALQKEMGVPA